MSIKRARVRGVFGSDEDYLHESKYADEDSKMDVSSLPSVGATGFSQPKMNPSELIQLVKGIRGDYGEGQQYRVKQAEIRDLRRKQAEYRKAYKRQGRRIPFEDGSVGYGKYKRRRVMRRAAPLRSRKMMSRRRGRGSYKPVFQPVVDYASNIANKTWSAVKSVFGAGAYGLGAYSSGASAAVEDQEVPTITNPGGSDGPVVIRHKEFINDIVVAASDTGVDGTQPFHLFQSLIVNPGNAVTFPWLSTIASSFTQYRFCGLQFWFKSTSGSLSTTQALGEIILSTEYNVNSPPPTSKVQMLNEIFSVSKVPAFDAHCDIETDPKQSSGSGLLYVSDNNAIPVAGESQDLRWQNLCNFLVATQGTQVASGKSVVLGELWVTYQVELYKPQLPLQANAGDFAHYSQSAALYTGLPDTVVCDQIGLVINKAANTITFPPLPTGVVIQVQYFLYPVSVPSLTFDWESGSLSGPAEFYPILAGDPPGAGVYAPTGYGSATANTGIACGFIKVTGSQQPVVYTAFKPNIPTGVSVWAILLVTVLSSASK